MSVKWIIACVMAGGVSAPVLADCPTPVDSRVELLSLFDQARDAKTFTEGRRAALAMWDVWLRAPDEAAQEVLDAGLRKRDSFDFLGALAEFDRLATYCPAYAEGFNQRAYIHFLRQDYEKALVDLDAALVLQPLHVAAQSGRALTLMNLGRLDEARTQLLQAVENNPWLSEAALLAEGAPLGVKGRDL
ncbi:MAG: tetratricopeptide (TPR) repeat protein [Sulfitobacter sp.]|jgi:tetratricopeptide (TPR) repeat protein